MIKALAKRIIVSKVDLEPQKKKLLIMPNEKEPCTAYVIAMGSEVDTNLEIGDIVHLQDDVGFPVEINGKTYLSVNEMHVMVAWKDK